MSRRSGRRSFNIDPNQIPEDEDVIEHSQTESQSQHSFQPDTTTNPQQFKEEEEELNNGEEEDELINEEDEVTRCICLNDELQQSSINPHLATLLKKEFKIEIDQGLFIQCDKCHVWQHGYCVGLYENDDVPDKYWCELCKPELHIIVKNDQYSKRTLYKPVNDKRKKIEMFDEENYGTTQMTKPRRKEKVVKKERKERRHHSLNEDYDEQLQKALRESAKESGIQIHEETLKRSRNESDDEIKKDELSEENDNEITSTSTTTTTKVKRRIKKKLNNNNQSDSSTILDKETVIKQNSKPRFVNEKSSIYELRKRTSAILEFLGRSQIELQDELESKSQLFKTLEINLFNENLKIMENLTNQIISWEEKFGKYAP